MTRVVRVHQLGGPEVLRIDDLELPAPGPGEVRLRVEAIGLNRAEAMFRSGNYPVKPPLPTFIGYEGAGVITQVGTGVQGYAVGDRICVVPNFRLGELGIYAEEAVVPVKNILHAPPGLSSVEAAAVWMQYCTAMAIVEPGPGRATVGDYVIIRAASSSVGIAAIQLANWAGATPIAATRRSDKSDALKALGAQHVIATDEQDLVKEVMRITDGKGARLVFDPVGGDYVATLANAMSEEGILFIYGSLSNQPTTFPHWPAAFKSLSVRGWVASYIWGKPDRYARAQDVIRRGLASGHLKPVIAKTFPFGQIAEAHRYLESNQQLGKVVVTVNS